jgi:Fe-S-cluster containining protein
MTLDCRTCGACCRGRPGTILVDRFDLTRFAEAGRTDVTAGLVPGHFSLDALPTDADGRCLHQGTEHSPLD